MYELIRKFVFRYDRSVSYIDALVGEVIDKLALEGLDTNTVVAFMSDHGFHLGEHNAWCKSTLYEDSLRIPLMLHVPGQTDAGLVTDKMVGAIDVMPTLIEAAGLGAVPACPSNGSAEVDLCTEGRSLLPLIEDTELCSWSTEVFSQVYRNGNVSKQDL